MTRTESCKSAQSIKGRLIPFMKLPGPRQMAIDEMLLEDSINNSAGSPKLRFYNWEGPWLSIGHNQKELPSRWFSLLREKKLQIVRRPSGGGAVLHGYGLTYALIWPLAPRKRRESYYETNEWLRTGFRELGMPLEFGNKACNSIETDCFSRSTEADLLDENGYKRIGNAQFWRKGHLLQHGEILLDPPEKLWMDVFNSRPPKPAPIWITPNGIEIILQKALEARWANVHWQKSCLTQQEWEEVSKQTDKYVVPFTTQQHLTRA